jgi:hypothetical protein
VLQPAGEGEQRAVCVSSGAAPVHSVCSVAHLRSHAYGIASRPSPRASRLLRACDISASSRCVSASGSHQRQPQDLMFEYYRTLCGLQLTAVAALSVATASNSATPVAQRAVKRGQLQGLEEGDRSKERPAAPQYAASV